MESKVIKYSEKVLGTKKITEEAIKGIAELSIPNNNYCEFIFLSEEEGALEEIKIKEEKYYIIGRDVLHNKLLLNSLGEVYIYSEKNKIITFVNSSLKMLIESMQIGIKMNYDSDTSLYKVNMQQIENFEDELRKIDSKALEDENNYWIYEIESLVKLV